jgi:hypothetical protein
VDTEADAGVLHQFDVNVSEITEAVGSEGDQGEPLAGAGA